MMKDKEIHKLMPKMSEDMPMMDMNEMMGNNGKHPTMPMPECKKMESKPMGKNDMKKH